MGNLCFQEGWHWQIGDGTTTALTPTPRASFSDSGQFSFQVPVGEIMEASIPWIFWTFPIVFTVHNIEEALWLPKFSKSAGKYHQPVDRFEFVFALVIITLLATIITVLFYWMGKQSIPCYLFFAFNFGMFINVFFPHFVATIALRRYCPGLLTGILLLAPTTVYLLRYGYDNGYFDLPKFWLITIPFASLVVGSIPILFKVGKYLEKMVGLRSSGSAAP